MSDAYPGDEILLQRIGAGDGDALLALHRRYVNLVYSLALRVLRDVSAAEEITQDVFVKLWQKSARYDPARGGFSTWLLSVTRFASIDRLRREGRRPIPADIPESEDGDSWTDRIPGTDHAAWEQGQQLRLLLEQLPEDQRNVVALAYFAGMSHSEMAEQLGLPLGTIKGRLRLGLEKLRSLWLDEIASDRGRVRP